MACHSSTLAWKIPWTEEPGSLQSTGSQRVRHDWATSLSLFTFMHWRRKWQPTPVFLPGESQGREPGGLPSMGSHRVGHNWCDLAAAGNFTLKSWFVHSFIGVSFNKGWLRGCCQPWRMWREQGFQVPDLLYTSDTKARATQRMTDRMGTCISPMAWRQYLSYRERRFPLQSRTRGHSGNSTLDAQVSWPWTGRTTTGV